MKKSIFVMSILLPAIAHGASADGTPVVETTPVAPVKLEQSVKLLNSCDLEDAGIALALTDKQLKITGTLPKDCADRLSLSSVKHSKSAKSSDELEGSLDKVEDLKEYAATIEAQITFMSDDQNKSLRDCVLNAKPDSAKVELSQDPHFARTITNTPEIAIAGIAGDPMELKSPEFQKMELQMKQLNCASCNSDWSKTRAHLKAARGVDSPLLSSMMNKLFEGSLADLEKKIESATALSELQKISKQLDEMSEFITTEEHRSLQLAILAKIGERNSFIATKPDHKTRFEATRHADFARDTYAKMAAVPGLPSEQSEDLKQKAADLAPGKEARIQFLSAIDGDHPEVRKYLNDSEKDQHKLQTQMQIACMSRNFTQCGALQKQIADKQKHVTDIQARYSLAYNDNVNGVFSYWDKRNTAYDQNLRSVFTQPVMSISSNTAGYFYDPKDPAKYQNIESSKMYQPNAMSIEAVPFYNGQPYSLAPVNS